MKDLDDNSIDLIVCDLPYGKIIAEWDNVVPMHLLWKEYERISKNDAAIILFGSGLFASKLALSNEKLFKYEIIWHKNRSGGPMCAKFRPLPQHENIMVFGKGKTKYNPQMVEGMPYNRKERDYGKINNMKYGVKKTTENNNQGTRYPISVQFFPQNWRRQDQQHPTQKPISLLEWLIKSYSNENDLVLDNCAGMGSTGIASKNLNRDFILMEIEEKYCEIISNNLGLKST